VFEITESAIGLEALTRAVSDPKAGAIATFLGTTRENNRGRRVVKLEYEAYADAPVSTGTPSNEMCFAALDLLPLGLVMAALTIPVQSI
jgi:hypothetical protein